MRQLEKRQQKNKLFNCDPASFCSVFRGMREKERKKERKKEKGGSRG